jgi:undecaprenyl-phosphate 4-deoxy-4-formamido-L-arabinose transferase
VKPLPHGISVVVPVYNSADSLDRLLDRLGAVLQQYGRPFEVLLVNDGSSDRSWEVIAEHAATIDWLRGINLIRNYGQHNALLCGLRSARFELTVTLDDDLQNPPEEIPRLVDALEDQPFDVVYGTSVQRHHSLGHNISARLLKFGLSVALGARTAKIVSPFRVLRTRLRDAFADNRSPWVILDVFLTWGTTRFGSIDVRHAPREVGRTKYTLRKRFVQALDLITGFSTLPLKIASLIGFFFTLFGIGLLTYVLAVYLVFGSTVPGWVFLASTIAIFSGAQLFALGVVGEYLARMFVRIMGRPAYFVGETTDQTQTEAHPIDPQQVGHRR